jgi:hypothetical protein
MKKLMIVLVIALLPALAFADMGLQIGGTAMYKGLLSDILDGPDGITLQDFTYGAEARLNFGLIQGAAALLYYPGTPNEIVALTDIGVTLNLAIVRLGAGIGPNFRIPLGGAITGVPMGLNLKGAVDLQLGKLSLGLVGYYYLASFSDLTADLFKTAQPWVGLTLLYQLF